MTTNDLLSGSLDTRRKLTYLLVAGVLAVGYALLRGSTWQGSFEIHTFMEGLAMALALTVGAMALVRYYTKKNNTFLLIGIGFLGTAILDGSHAIVTSVYFAPFSPSDLPSLIGWSWIASRLFLATMLCLSWLVWVLDRDQAEEQGSAELVVYMFAGGLTIASILFFLLVPLPRAYYPDLFFHRPEEFVPAALFLVALVGYLRKGDWRHDIFEHWLVLALIVSVFSQAVFMASSSSIFDLEFDAAQLLKMVSYICVLTGLLSKMHAIFVSEEKRGLRLTREVDERKLAESLVQETAQRLQTLFDAIPDGVISIDQTGAILSFNPGAEKLFGYERTEVLGSNIKMLMPDNFASAHNRHLAGYNETPGSSKQIGKNRALTGLRADGTIFPIDLTINEMRTKDQRKFVGIIRDITERTKAEEHRKQTERELRRHVENTAKTVAELARTNSELEQFAYIASHDLQEPLRKVQAFSDRLQAKYKDVLDDQGLDYLFRMNDAAERMQTLVMDLLAYSRMSPKGEDFTPLALDNIIREATRDLDFLIEELGATIEFDELPAITAIPLQMRQLFQNLISNALKYRREGVPPIIRISGEVIDSNLLDVDNPPIKICKITVTDNGLGFDEQYAERIFGIFQRLHGRSEYTGTGVGLAICRKIVDGHGGKISAQSTPGEGSTFTVILPLTNQSLEQHQYG